MTIKEAKEVLQEQIDKYGQEYDAEGIDALDMAIKALEQEPCEDCISRQAVKDMLDARGVKAVMTFEHFKELLDNLPSVTPQPKQSIDRVCDILAEMFETPCDYRFNDIDIDEFMSEDGYCENHCSDGCYGECWKRFFEKYDKFSKESKNEDSN